MWKKTCICSSFWITAFAVVFGLLGINGVKSWAEEGISSEEYEAKINLLEAKIKRLEKEKEETLKKYNKAMEDHIADINEIKQLNQQINDEKKKTQEAGERLNKKDAIIKDLQTQLNDKTKRLDEKTTENQELIKTSIKIDQQNKQNQIELKEKNETITRLQNELKTTKESLENKLQENSTLISKLDKEQQKSQEITDKLKQTLDELDKFQKQLSTVQMELETAEKQVEDYKNKENEIEKNRLESEKEKTQQKDLSEKLNTQLAENKKIYDDYTTKIVNLKASDALSKLLKEDVARYQNYVSNLYTLNLNKINDLTIDELSYYLYTYPEFEKTDEYLYLIGGLYQKEKDRYSACATYLKLITLYPESPFVAKAKSSLDQLNKAIGKDLYARIKKFPSSKGETRIARFFIYLKDLHSLNRKEFYNYSIKQQIEFLNLYKDAKESVDVYWLMAETYHRLKEDYKAIATYLKITQIYPSYPEVSRLADAYYAVGDTFNKLHEYNSAISFYEKAIALLPDYKKSPDYLLTIARLYKTELKQSDKAITTYNRLCSAYHESPKSPTAFFELGQYYEKLNRWQDAIKTYQQLVKDYPSNSLAPSSVISLGGCYEKIGDYANAIDTYISLADKYSGYISAKEKLFDAAGLCEEKLSDVKRAVEIYQKVINKYPENKFAKKAQKRIEKLTKEK